MNTPFTIELIKLANGARLLRVIDNGTGTCLERALRPDIPVVVQKKLLSHALHSLLERELKETASAA
jgi:hypothetical protein